MMHKKKLSLRTETVATLLSDAMRKVNGGLCADSVRPSEWETCNPCPADPTPLSCGFCQRG